MNTEELLTDPVFHLNLLVWMTIPLPDEPMVVNPIFKNLGFKLNYLERDFKFPEPSVKAIEASGLPISTSPKPEAILKTDDNSKALYFEAKANSFGTASSNCKQARGHLLACGPAFTQTFRPIQSALLCYLTPQKAAAPMSVCLKDLTGELSNKNLQPGKFSCHGIELKNGEIVYSWDEAFKQYANLSANEEPVIRNLQADTDPSPYVLIVTGDECSSSPHAERYRRVLIEKSRAMLLCALHPLAEGERHIISADLILGKVTQDTFQYLGQQAKKSLSRLIRENVFRRIAEYWRDSKQKAWIAKQEDNSSLVVYWNTVEEKEEFLDWLEDKRTTFKTDKPDDKSEPNLTQPDLGF